MFNIPAGGKPTHSTENCYVPIFISGSSTGLGLMAGELLVEQQVVLHARNAARAADAKLALPGAEAIVEGDLDTIAGTKEVAARVNALGRFDAVIHNADPESDPDAAGIHQTGAIGTRWDNELWQLLRRHIPVSKLSRSALNATIRR
jgi:NAD(P)-dependent dehydrogenase (short-subunit alcohol dehydrogenase family)